MIVFTKKRYHIMLSFFWINMDKPWFYWNRKLNRTHWKRKLKKKKENGTGQILKRKITEQSNEDILRSHQGWGKQKTVKTLNKEMKRGKKVGKAKSKTSAWRHKPAWAWRLRGWITPSIGWPLGRCRDLLT